MQTPISLKSAERKAFQTTFADGLWDVFIGCFALQFAIAPLLSETLGDFWSSVIFLPFWGLVYLAIWLIRKYILRSRLGTVRLGKTRRRKLAKFSLIMVTLNILALIFGVLAVIFFDKVFASGISSLYPLIFGSIVLAGFSTAAYILDYTRLYLYGLLVFAAPLVGEWLYRSYGATHHGFPITFGFAAAVMILTGIILFVRLLVKNPPVESLEA